MFIKVLLNGNFIPFLDQESWVMIHGPQIPGKMNTFQSTVGVDSPWIKKTKCYFLGQVHHLMITGVAIELAIIFLEIVY